MRSFSLRFYLVDGVGMNAPLAGRVKVKLVLWQTIQGLICRRHCSQMAETGEQAVREADGMKFDDLAGIVDEKRAAV